MIHYDDIKKEVELEYEALLKQKKFKTKEADGVEKMEAISEHFQNSDAFYRALIDKLNVVLIRHEITLEDEKEKKQFQEYISPTLKEYMSKFLAN